MMGEGRREEEGTVGEARVPRERRCYEQPEHGGGGEEVVIDVELLP